MVSVKSSRWLATILSAAALALAAGPAVAQNAGAVHVDADVGVGANDAAADTAASQVAQPMALRGIMQNLAAQLQDVTGAIAYEDWLQVAELAPQIAKHAQPPAEEKARILAWLGPQAPQFRAQDQRVAQAARNMATAAQAGDGAGVIDALSKVQQACLACHQSWRAPFVEHFYGAD